MSPTRSTSGATTGGAPDRQPQPSPLPFWPADSVSVSDDDDDSVAELPSVTEIDVPIESVPSVPEPSLPLSPDGGSLPMYSTDAPS